MTGVHAPLTRALVDVAVIQQAGRTSCSGAGSHAARKSVWVDRLVVGLFAADVEHGRV